MHNPLISIIVPVYNGEKYTDGDALADLERSIEANESSTMHPQTKRELMFVLTMLRDRGEKETFRFIREVVLKNRDVLPNSD